MIDTIKFRIEYPTKDLMSIAGTIENTKTVLDSQSGEVIYTQTQLNNMHIYMKRLIIYGCGSLAKFYLGNNVVPFDWSMVPDALSLLSDKLHYDVREAKISRLDIGCNLQMEYPVSRYLAVCKGLSRFKRVPYGNSTLYYKQKGKTLILYDKIQEMKNKNGKEQIPPEYRDEYLLRYELQLIRHLHSLFKYASAITGATLCDEAFQRQCMDMWYNYYCRIGKAQAAQTFDKALLSKPTDAYQYYMGMLMSQGMSPEDFLLLLKQEEIFIDPKSYSRLKQMFDKAQAMYQAASIPNIDLIAELDRKIKEAYDNAFN